MRQVVEVLNSLVPALVVLQGEVGMGKTTVLREVESRSREIGWRTVPPDDGNTLIISADTTELLFKNQVSAWAVRSRQDRFPDFGNLSASSLGTEVGTKGLPNPSERAQFSEQTATPQSTWAGPARPDAPPDWVGSSLSSLGTEVGTKGSPNASELAARPRIASEQPLSPQIALDPLVELLASLSPVLLAIDGYRPDREFADWFEGRFIAELKNLSKPVVIIVANQPDTTESLRAKADLTIDIGPLDHTAVRAHLEMIAREVFPPLTQSELDVYVDQTSGRPDLLFSLTRILALAKPTGSR